jgi:hypothetical protein
MAIGQNARKVMAQPWVVERFIGGGGGAHAKILRHLRVNGPV